jgi:hypothetical protein
MNKTMEVLLTALALAGLFCAIPNSTPANISVRSQNNVIVADGSDPMPICRGKRCF